MKKFTLFLYLIVATTYLCAQELAAYRLNLVRHPETKKYGYAFKEQNINSPIRGTTSAAVNMLGSGASVLIGKSAADNIDWAIPPQYDDAASKFKENLAMVKVNGKVGFIDLYNRFIIEPIYDDVDEMDGFHQGVAAVKKNGKWGYINKEGKCIIPFEYDEADAFDEDMIATVKVGEFWGAIDIEGKMVVTPEKKIKATMTTVPGSNKEYRAAVAAARERKNNGSYDNRIAAIQKATAAVNKRIANKSKQALKYTKVGSGNERGIVDNYGRVIVPSKYSEITYDANHRVYIVKQDNLYGAYLYNGSRLIAPCFDNMSLFSNNKSTVKACGVKGWINTDGELSGDLLNNMLLAGIEAKKTNKTKARSIYERILMINPECGRAYNNIALLDIEAEDYSKGMKKLKLAHELDPDDEVIKKNLEWAKESRKERRQERLMTGLSIATAIVGIAATSYATYSAIKDGGDVASSASSASAGSAGSSYSSSGSGGSSSKSSSTCHTCGGTGTCTSSSATASRYYCHGTGNCGYCNGSGIGSYNTVCTACKGTGVCKYCKGKGHCKTCKGSGTR